MTENLLIDETKKDTIETEIGKSGRVKRLLGVKSTQISIFKTYKEEKSLDLLYKTLGWTLEVESSQVVPGLSYFVLVSHNSDDVECKLPEDRKTYMQEKKTS